MIVENIKNIKKLNNINLLHKIENNSEYSVKINFNEKAQKIDTVLERGNKLVKCALCLIHFWTDTKIHKAGCTWLYNLKISWLWLSLSKFLIILYNTGKRYGQGRKIIKPNKRTFSWVGIEKAKSEHPQTAKANSRRREPKRACLTPNNLRSLSICSQKDYNVNRW